MSDEIKEDKVNDQCVDCGVDISEKVAKYSRDIYKRALCMSCQQKERDKRDNKKASPDANKGSVAAVDSPKGIITIQGKKYATHEYLLNKAHSDGLEGIDTEVVSTEPYIIKAVVSMKNGRIFCAHGDATEENVGKMIAPHMIRMAETRAVNRALRFATNTSYCSVEELGE